MKGLGEVEHHIRREFFQFLDNGNNIVENGQRFHLMSQLLQAGEHIRFRLLVLVLFERARRESFAGRGWAPHVEQDQYLHTDLLKRPVCR